MDMDIAVLDKHEFELIESKMKVTAYKNMILRQYENNVLFNEYIRNYWR